MKYVERVFIAAVGGMICIFGFLIFSGSSLERSRDARDATELTVRSKRTPKPQQTEKPRRTKVNRYEQVKSQFKFSRSATNNGITKVTYQWGDINRPHKEVEPLSYETDIDLGEMAVVISSFGIPNNVYTNRLYSRTKAELQKKLEARTRFAFTRGILLPLLPNPTITINYAWMVKRSQGDFVEMTKQLVELAHSRGYETRREIIGLIASFVQSMPYQIPEGKFAYREGYTMRTLGVRMPLETLHNGWGDCDTKSVLLGTLLAGLDGSSVIFLRGNQHLFLGVNVELRPKDHYVTFAGKDYVLVEATVPWKLGRIPDKNWEAVQNNEFEIKLGF